MPTAPIPPDPELLDRYLAGECSDIERRTIETWLREHPDAAVRAGIVSYVAQYPLSGLRQTREDAYAAFLARVRAAGDAPPPRIGRTTPRPARHVPRWAAGGRTASREWLAAAAIVALVGAGSFAVIHGRQARDRKASAPILWQSFASSHAQRTVIDLADGTHVVLAPESELRVRQAPADRPAEMVREVELTGEGFFRVAHVADRPFVIRTAHGAVTQLGTAFDVRSYRGEKETRVAVTEGRVDLRPLAPAGAPTPSSRSARPVVLAAGDLGTMADDGVKHVARGIDAAAYTAWVDGTLRYVNAPLGTVLADLQRWYDVRIELQDPTFAGYRLTAVLPHGSVDDVIDVVVKSLDLRAQRSGSLVRIVGKNAQPPKRP